MCLFMCKRYLKYLYVKFVENDKRKKRKSQNTCTKGTTPYTTQGTLNLVLFLVVFEMVRNTHKTKACNHVIVKVFTGILGLFKLTHLARQRNTNLPIKLDCEYCYNVILIYTFRVLFQHTS